MATQSFVLLVLMVVSIDVHLQVTFRVNGRKGMWSINHQSAVDLDMEVCNVLADGVRCKSTASSSLSIKSTLMSFSHLVRGRRDRPLLFSEHHTNWSGSRIDQ